MIIDNEIIRVAQDLYVKSAGGLCEEEIDLELLDDCFNEAYKIVKATRIYVSQCLCGGEAKAKTTPSSEVQQAPINPGNTYGNVSDN